MRKTGRRRHIGVAAGSSLVLAVGAVLGTSVTPAAAASDAYFTTIVTDQDHYEGQTWTEFEMQQEGMNMSTPDVNYEDYDTSTMTEDQANATNVPSGYKYNGGQKRSDYIYQSTYWALELMYCSGSPRKCKVLDRWDVVLKQTLNGGESRKWTLSPVTTHKFGSSYPSFSFTYWCGTNKTLATDTLCAGAGADHSDSGVFNPGDAVYKHFGATNNRVYPMVQISVLWSGGQRASAKFRGWDVCNSSTLSKTAKLCSTWS